MFGFGHRTAGQRHIRYQLLAPIIPLAMPGGPAGRGAAAAKGMSEEEFKTMASSLSEDQLKKLAQLAESGRSGDSGSEGGESEESEKGWRHKLKIVLPHVILVVGTLLYTLLGAGVFYFIERPHEVWLKERHTTNVRQLQEELLTSAWDLASSPVEKRDWELEVRRRLDSVLKTTFTAFERGVKPNEISGDADIAYAWTYPSAIFFSTTVITTVGYGHLVPVTVLGRLFCIVYALLGIPLCLITIADIGKFVGQGIAAAYDAWKELLRRIFRRRVRTGLSSAFSNLRSQATGMVGSADSGPAQSTDKTSEGGTDEKDLEPHMEEEQEYEMLVSPSLVLFLLLSYTTLFSAIFFYSEGWTFLQSFYYCFITMVTVGFGDLVPSSTFYLPLVVIFIFSGLMLTTISIDLVGTHYINKLHYFGRNIGDWWKQMKVLQSKYGLTDDQLRVMMNDARRRGRAYAPSEAAIMSYIDNVPSIDEAASLVSCLDL